MAQFYTKAELCNMLQDKLGVKQGSDNRRFTYPRCWPAIAEAIEQWVPWLPTDMQSAHTEKVQTLLSWPAGAVSYNLPTEVARFLSIMPTAGSTYVELYGLDPGDPNNFGDRKAFDDRCQFLRRTSGIKLFCLLGKMLRIYPTPGSSFAAEITYRAYLGAPGGDDSYVYIEKTAVPFIITTAAVSGKLGDLRVQESLALLQEQNAMMKNIFGIKDRENTPPKE